MARKVLAKEGWIIMRGTEYVFPPNIYDSKKRCKEVIDNLEKIDPKRYSGLTPKDLAEPLAKEVKSKKIKKKIIPKVNEVLEDRPSVILNNDVNVLDI